VSALDSSSGSAPAGTASSSVVVSQVLAMLRGQGGVTNGLSSLLQAFESGGLGHLFQSWVSSGQNLPVSAQQIQSVLGNSGMLQRIAQATGMQPADVAQHLSVVLPQIRVPRLPVRTVRPHPMADAVHAVGMAESTRRLPRLRREAPAPEAPARP